MHNFLDSIIEQAVYLRDTVEIPDELADEITDYVRSADSLLDDACNTVNDYKNGDYIP